MKKINWYSVGTTFFTTLGAMLVIMMILWAGGIFNTLATEQTEQEPIVKYVEVQKEQMFDTSVIETQWCGGCEDGTIRMVGAWWYADEIGRASCRERVYACV